MPARRTTGRSTRRAPHASSPRSTPAAIAPTRSAKVEVPTLVVHGRDDTLITPSGGTLTAEAIPEASLLLIAHMGHDLPEPLWPVIIDAVISHTVARHDERLRRPPCPDH